MLKEPLQTPWIHALVFLRDILVVLIFSEGHTIVLVQTINNLKLIKANVPQSVTNYPKLVNGISRE